ncbi:MAG: VCBS repeat-containing protein [Myxococcales bacterium]|nr:VCBS repeat-containing protein [Myxococcales bacterium]
MTTTTHRARISRRIFAALLVIVPVAMMGCGPDDPQTTDVAGAFDAGIADVAAGDSLVVGDGFVGDGVAGDAGRGVDSSALDSSATLDVSEADVHAADGGAADIQAFDGAADGSDFDAADAIGVDAELGDAEPGDAGTDAKNPGDSGLSDGSVVDGTSPGDGTTSPFDGVGPNDGAAASGDSGTTGGDSGAPLPSWPPWSADAWSSTPLPPVAQSALPTVTFSDISTTLGLNSAGSWAFCAATGFIDADDQPDAVFIELTSGPGGAQGATIKALRAGPNPKVVSSKMNTSLLYPDGGCALADMSGDGFADLLIGGSSGLAYYKGDGKGGFVDESAKRLPKILTAKVWSIAVDDYDGDGRLDVYLGAGKAPDTCTGGTCGYTKDDFSCTFNTKPPADPFDDDRLLLQTAAGTLVDATGKWAASKGGILTSAASWDFDLDGFADVLVGNDFGGHWVLPNLKGKGFGKPEHSGLLPYAHAMGWGIGDLNGDGATDLVLADIGPLNIYAGKPGSAFGPWIRLPSGHPVFAATWHTSSWVPLLGDLDHDGDEDIYLGVSMAVTGGMGAELTQCKSAPSAHAASDYVLRNDGGLAFTTFAVKKSKCGRVAALAQSMIDIDGDGDLDVVQVRPGCGGYLEAQIRVLRNELTKTGGSVRVRLVGKIGNADAIGARLTTTVANKPVTRRLVGTVGVGSSGPRRIHLGLGSANETGPITVIWPGGKSSQHPPLKDGASVVWKAP